MPTSYNPTITQPTDAANVSANIASLSDVANIVTAFQNYHNNISWYFNRKANLAGATFTGNVAGTNLTLSGSINFTSVIPTDNTTGTITVNNTSGTYTGVGRIFVESTQPNNAVSKTGDLWMW